MKGVKVYIEVLQVHEDAKESVALDLKAVCIAIDACGRGAAWQVALGYFARTLRRDIAIVNAIGTACARGGEWARALRILRRGVDPDVVTFGSAIAACNLGSKWRLALSLLHEMPFRGLVASAACIGAAMAACETLGQDW